MFPIIHNTNTVVNMYNLQIYTYIQWEYTFKNVTVYLCLGKEKSKSRQKVLVGIAKCLVCTQ